MVEQDLPTQVVAEAPQVMVWDARQNTEQACLLHRILPWLGAALGISVTAALAALLRNPGVWQHQVMIGALTGSAITYALAVWWRRQKRPSASSYAIIASVLIAVLAGAILYAGFAQASLYWGLLVVLLASILISIRTGQILAIGLAVMAAVFTVLEVWNWPVPVFDLGRGATAVLELTTFLLTVLVGTHLIQLHQRSMQQALTQLTQHASKLADINEQLERETVERRRSEEALGAAREELEQQIEGRTAALKQANEELHAEITERKRVEEALRQLNEGLEVRASKRAAELTRKNAQLLQEIEDRKQIEETLLQRNRELLSLQAAAAATASSLDRRFVLETVTWEMAELLNVEGCSIFEWSRETDTLFVVAEYSTAGLWEPGSAVQAYKLADYPLRRRVLAERTAHQMTLTQPGIDSTEREHMQGTNIKTLLLLPVVFQDRVIGLIEITDSQAERVFTDHEVSVVQLLANQAAIAMENARLYEQAQREIMERKRTERALERYTVDLERSNEDLQQFAYVASHDLQEPLRMVTSYVQLLERRYKGKLDADADEFIHFAVDGATRMHELIKGLLAYSRVGTHGDPFEPTDCQLVLDQVLDNLQVAIEEKAAEVTYDPLPTVMADAMQLGQLFQNLVSNSIKFHGDQPPRIHVSVERQASDLHEEAAHWLFSVQDNGIGIESQYLERVFLIFQRLHPRESYPGMGIGLTICKRIVERHGGRIWAESVPGRGSTFHFTLPDRIGV